MTLPEHVVVETTEHKCLQSQFSVLYNEAMQLKTQLEDARNQLQVAKNAHIRQIEQMEAEELLAQKKLRAEAIQLEDLLAQVRKEYEMLRIEFEQVWSLTQLSSGCFLISGQGPSMNSGVLHILTNSCFASILEVVNKARSIKAYTTSQIPWVN